MIEFQETLGSADAPNLVVLSCGLWACVAIVLIHFIGEFSLFVGHDYLQSIEHCEI